MRPIPVVAEELGLSPEHVLPWGPGRAKIDLAAAGPSRGRIVLVSAMTPTPAGEGKTTTTISIAMGLRRRRRSVVACLREPSMGPIFGRKGGGTGGGKATIEPSDAINLHFTGDKHAITSAHNLLAALTDHALDRRGPLDVRKTRWRRVVDMNDKALRRVMVGLEGVIRESAFDITAASEIMAVLCLADSREDLAERLGRLVVGEDAKGNAITAADLRAVGPMTALLHEAVLPNLVQTADGGPVLVHGGPFANIAHGCNSRIGTRMGLAHADVVVTEAGFGFELGAEKYLHIKARAADLWPSLVAIVVTQRALRWHGEGDPSRGLRLLEHELSAVAKFGLPAVVVLNAFPDDDAAVSDAVLRTALNAGAGFAPSYGYARGAEGCLELADVVGDAVMAAGTRDPQWLYPLDLPIPEKIERVARALYAAEGVVLEDQAKKDLARIAPLGNFPVCIAKTPASLTGNPKLVGYREGHVLSVKELRLHAGAGFVVALAGEISTMPGLPNEPNAWNIRVEDGRVVGLEGKGG